MSDLEKDQVVETPKEDEVQTPELSADEQAALAKGWKPKDQWDGPEDEWKPAKVFNEIGELKERVSEREKELKKSHKLVQIMKTHHLNVRQAAYEQAVKDLKAQRTEALKEEKFAEAEVLRDQIDDMKDKFQNQDVLPREIEPEAAEPDPEFFRFVDRNPWYKPGGKDEMSKEADALGLAYKAQNPNADFKDLIADVEKKIRKLYPEKFERPKTGPNEGGSRGAGSSTSSNPEKLSEEQRAIARSFGMTDAQYAKEFNSYKGR